MSEFTQEERDRAGEQVDKLAGEMRTKTFHAAVIDAAIQLACERNRMRDALKPFVAFHDVYRTMKGVGQDEIYSCHSHVHGEGILTEEMFNAAREVLEVA